MTAGAAGSYHQVALTSRCKTLRQAFFTVYSSSTDMSHSKPAFSGNCLPRLTGKVFPTLSLQTLGHASTFRCLTLHCDIPFALHPPVLSLLTPGHFPYPLFHSIICGSDMPCDTPAQNLLTFMSVPSLSDARHLPVHCLHL